MRNVVYGADAQGFGKSRVYYAGRMPSSAEKNETVAATELCIIS